MKKLLALAALTAVSAVPSFAQTIATWTFETTSGSITGSGTSLTGIAADSGTGTASQVHASSATYSSPAGNGSAHSFSANTWGANDYTQFSFSTTGLHGISLSFDQTSSSTGPKDWTLSYSLNGTTFTTFNFNLLPPSERRAPNVAWNATTSSSVFTISRMILVRSSTILRPSFYGSLTPIPRPRMAAPSLPLAPTASTTSASS